MGQNPIPWPDAQGRAFQRTCGRRAALPQILASSSRVPGFQLEGSKEGLSEAGGTPGQVALLDSGLRKAEIN